MGAEQFRFEGKQVLVVGGATGMGASAAQLAAELGGQVTVLDLVEVENPSARSVHVDLSVRESVDDALAALSDRFDVLFSCAGVADGSPGLMRINFISQRHIIDRMVEDGRLGPGAAVGMISSIGGYAWQSNIDRCLEFLANDSWEAMEAWIDANGDANTYTFSKQAMNAYVATRALEFATAGMRINAIMPGGTDTPLARKNPETWMPFQGEFRQATGRPHLTPEQMGNVLAFLCMDAASGVNGATLVVDDGYMASGIARTLQSPVVAMLSGL